MSETMAERWRRTCELFHELSDLDPAERQRQLADVATDPELRAAVESLLAADEVADEQLAELTHGISDVLRRNAMTPLPAATTEDRLRLVGATVSHFSIIEPIGAGGMGIVYRAEDTRLGREVALKLPLAAVQLDAGGRARFLREAHAAGALDHPNLCSVHEVGESDDGRLFLAMPLYEGETLKNRIARNGPFTVTEAVDVAAQLAHGLAFAHDAGVIHRDLKPGNVMVLNDGTAKILDFGLAKLTDMSDSLSGVNALGTASYMAPEQVRGGIVDARADLWSLGVLLYEMLTGVRPFHGEDSVAVAHAILHEAVAPPSARQPAVPRVVDDIVLTLLEKDPADRYGSARDVAADLTAVECGASLSIRRRVPARLSRWRRARSVGARASLAFVAVAAIVTLAATLQRVRPLLERRPTTNAEAYRFYLRGREYERTGPRAAAEMVYQHALTLDPAFALARARLAITHLTYASRPDRARIERGRAEALAALQAQPDLADAHYALGLYWARRNEHARALREFAVARAGLDDTPELHGEMGASYRALGRWDAAVNEFERALDLNPSSMAYAPALAVTYGRLRRYRESTRLWSRYIALNPDAYAVMLIKGWAYTRWEGRADTLAALIRRLPPDWDYNGMPTFSRVYVAQLRRQPSEALAALDASRATVSEDDMLYRPHSLLRAKAYADLGDSTRARAFYDSARRMLTDSITAHPNDPRLHVALGLSLAGLGRRDDAVREAEQAMALAPISADIVRATSFMGGAAEIFASLGDADRAIALLDRLLGLPAGREASVALLRADPAYDRIRGDPRFEQMLRRYSTN